MSVFDGIAKVAVDVTSKLFGDRITWVKDSSNTYSALGKYKDEPGDAKMGDTKYPLNNWSIEVKDSDFPGLRDMVKRMQKITVTVNVRGVDIDFTCLEASGLSDGFCTRIKLQKKA